METDHVTKRNHTRTSLLRRLGPTLTSAALALAVAMPAAASAQVSLSTIVDLAAKNSNSVKLAQADVAKARAALSQTKDAFLPSVSFGSGLPAFPEVGFTGNLPTLWDANAQSMVFNMPQFRYIQAANAGLRAAESNLKDAHEQVALDASTTYIELDTVNQELAAVHQQEDYANRLVDIEQQRAEAGVDPLSAMLQARLTAAQLKLKRLHLETRATTLSKQLSLLTGLPPASIVTDHASIPEIPAVKADEAPLAMPKIQAALEAARSKERIAKGDYEHTRLFPEIAFGIVYNRNTTVLNDINKFYRNPLPANNFSSGLSIQVPIFDAGARAKAHESAADALRARVEAEEAQRQSDLQIATLTSSLRELDAQAEVASLKQQISEEQLKAVLSQLEVGNGAGIGPGATPQLSPKAEQQVRIDERENYENALDAGLDLSKARLNLLRALGHMQDWLNELHSK
jgi:outer membrane protein TolC